VRSKSRRGRSATTTSVDLWHECNSFTDRRSRGHRASSISVKSTRDNSLPFARIVYSTCDSRSSSNNTRKFTQRLSRMCWVTVKDLEVDPPARKVKEVRRVSNYYPSPPPPARILETTSRTTIVEKRSTHSSHHTAPCAPSVRGPPSVAPTRASQRYVQVELDAESEHVSISNSSSSDDEVLSQTTRRSEGAKSRATHKSSHTSHSRAPSVPAPPNVRPRSEYSTHEREREIRREYTSNPGYETYRYVNAPSSRGSREHRRSAYDDENYRQLQVSIKNNRQC
jgi:hypothetical protein